MCHDGGKKYMWNEGRITWTNCWENVIKAAVLAVNFIRSRGINHSQFCDYLLEIDAAYAYLPYHIAIR